MGRLEAEWKRLAQIDHLKNAPDEILDVYRVMFYSGAMAISRCIAEMSELGQDVGYVEYVKVKGELAEFATSMLKGMEKNETTNS